MTRVTIRSGDRLKTGDTEPDLVVQLRKDNDNPKDLSTGNPTVSFALTEANENTLVVDDDTTGNVTISNATNGEITYSWQAGDTDVAGTYEGEIEVDDDAGVSSYPNRGTFKVHIEEGLN
jgi:hypothetical protein